jgi:class 3 adenylate cyclase
MNGAPKTSYARSEGARIAYQVVGEGPADLVLMGGPASHLEVQWDEPATARCLERIASFARLVRFDRRGTGLSDPTERPLTLEQQMDDLRAVMDAVGLERTALFGLTDAGLCSLFAATYPDRVTALVLYGVAPAGADAIPPELAEQFLEIIEERWGEGALLPVYAPSRVGDRQFEEWWARYERSVASPGMARKLLELSLEQDLHSVLPAIRVPTLVLHCTNDSLVAVERGRALADAIPGARFLELPGGDNYVWAGEGADLVIEELEEFLTGRRRPREPDRVLATVVFTDIVGSTERAAAIGDRAWHDLLDRHNALVRRELDRFRGREVKNTGDGFLATFDGPARAVRCAEAIVQGAGELGLRVRAGLHAGECELLNGDVGGIAVHIGSRVGALASADEVLVSGTVKDLVVGSGLTFADRGAHELKGVPGEWRLHSLER